MQASILPVTQRVFVARGAFPRSTPCVCALRIFLPGRVCPDRTTRRHGLARPAPNWVGWAERVVTDVAGLVHLRWLDLARNQLSAPPEGLADMTNLEILNRASNDINERDWAVFVANIVNMEHNLVC